MYAAKKILCHVSNHKNINYFFLCPQAGFLSDQDEPARPDSGMLVKLYGVSRGKRLKEE